MLSLARAGVYAYIYIYIYIYIPPTHATVNLRGKHNLNASVYRLSQMDEQRV
jgi:hypothetical protein